MNIEISMKNIDNYIQFFVDRILQRHMVKRGGTYTENMETALTVAAQHDSEVRKIMSEFLNTPENKDMKDLAEKILKTYQNNIGSYRMELYKLVDAYITQTFKLLADDSLQTYETAKNKFIHDISDTIQKYVPKTKQNITQELCFQNKINKKNKNIADIFKTILERSDTYV